MSTSLKLPIVAAVVVASCALAVALIATSLQRTSEKTKTSSRVVRAVPLHAGVQPQRIDDPATHWPQQGFVEMVPPVRLPSDRSGRDIIRVWLKVDDGKISARTLADGRVVLTYPAGTIADRVESMGDAVIDVRGTALAADDVEMFHVYVAEDEAPSALVGWQWRRGDFAAEASATEALLAQLDKTQRKLKDEPAPSAEQHANSLKSYERNNNCGACHAHEKPSVPRGDTVHRPTDAAGFFVPQSVLADVVPLERHRPWDVNVNDPFLDITCASGGKAELHERAQARQFTCASFEIPTGRLDVARGLAAHDEHTIAVCKSRRYLFDHMDDAARALFHRAFAVCGIVDDV